MCQEQELEMKNYRFICAFWNAGNTMDCLLLYFFKLFCLQIDLISAISSFFRLMSCIFVVVYSLNLILGEHIWMHCTYTKLFGYFQKDIFFFLAFLFSYLWIFGNNWCNKNSHGHLLYFELPVGTRKQLGDPSNFDCIQQ